MISHTWYHLTSHCICNAAPGIGQGWSPLNIAARCNALFPLLSTAPNTVSFRIFFFSKSWNTWGCLFSTANSTRFFFSESISWMALGWKLRMLSTISLIPFFAAINMGVGNLSTSSFFFLVSKSSSWSLSSNFLAALPATIIGSAERPALPILSSRAQLGSVTRLKIEKDHYRALDCLWTQLVPRDQILKIWTHFYASLLYVIYIQSLNYCQSGGHGYWTKSYFSFQDHKTTNIIHSTKLNQALVEAINDPK